MLPYRDLPTIKKPAYVLPETVALMCVGGFDLLFTIYLLASGKAYEANPFMENVLQKTGPHGFILVKALFLAGPLAIAEIAKKERLQFVQWALRFCLVIYIFALAIAYNRMTHQPVIRPAVESWNGSPSRILQTHRPGQKRSLCQIVQNPSIAPSTPPIAPPTSPTHAAA
jgi:hypothetical protein